MAELLVTGADGFIGTPLVRRLRDEGHHVIALDLADGDVADGALWSAQPDVEVVLHLAARSFVPDSWRIPTTYTRTNVLGTAEALEYCRARKARLVTLSSYMYGVPETLPIPETAQVAAGNPYALSKRLAEESCRFYAENLGVPVTILRPFNVYGPGQKEPFLVPLILRQLRESTEIRVLDLEPKRDYVYVADVVEALVRAVRPAEGFRVFNIGAGVSHSVGELIAEMQRAAGTNLPVISAEERRKDEVMDTIADIRAAAAGLGWTPRYTLAQGLQEILTAGR